MPDIFQLVVLPVFVLDFYVILIGNKNEIMCATDCGQQQARQQQQQWLTIATIVVVVIVVVFCVSHADLVLEKHFCGFEPSRNTFDFISVFSAVPPLTPRTSQLILVLSALPPPTPSSADTCPKFN